MKLLSRMGACFDRTIVLYNLPIDLVYHIVFTRKKRVLGKEKGVGPYLGHIWAKPGPNLTSSPVSPVQPCSALSALVRS